MTAYRSDLSHTLTIDLTDAIWQRLVPILAIATRDCEPNDPSFRLAVRLRACLRQDVAACVKRAIQSVDTPRPTIAPSAASSTR